MSLIEVEFKGRRKGTFSNPQEFPLNIKDKVVVRADRGEDIGDVTLVGPQWQDLLIEGLEEEDIEPVLRLASPADINIDDENRELEKEARSVFLGYVKKQNLVMKLVDSEYQLDRRKLTFHFTADGRVDFRALVKDLAHHFKTRIDLRQIGARDEAKRLGGIGLCGLELCCASWIREFKPVTTLMVKEQNLLLNPQKNTGLCGRLRCCLRYEVDEYREVNCKFPRVGTRVIGPRGEGIVEKVDRCCVACGISWNDGNKISFSSEEITKFSDWEPSEEANDLENDEIKTIIHLHIDPSYEEEKEGLLVASSDIVEQEKIDLRVSNNKQPKKDSRSHKEKISGSNGKCLQKKVDRPKAQGTVPHKNHAGKKAIQSKKRVIANRPASPANKTKNPVSKEQIKPVKKEKPENIPVKKTENLNKQVIVLTEMEPAVPPSKQTKTKRYTYKKSQANRKPAKPQQPSDRKPGNQGGTVPPPRNIARKRKR